MRKISAQYIYPVNSKPLKKGIVIVDEDGKIIEIIDTKGELKESAGVEFYNGVIVPGFVNTHCHLELSHLKGKIPKHTGHAEFIKQIVQNIQYEKQNLKKIMAADLEMQKQGIVAVGDISNTSFSFDVKERSPIHYNTFVEIADFFNIEEFKNKIKMAKEFYFLSDDFSFVAHAPYTSSPDFIAKTAELSKSVYSIHNQEPECEDEMYKYGSGNIYEMMKERKMLNQFSLTGKSSLQSYLPKIIRDDLNILLIHNTFTFDDDIKFAESLSKNIYWTLCPNSNLYIQNKLPDVQKFIKNNCKITLGTDSLATNDKLSILAEMKNFKNVNFSEVLKWATLNGAKALKIDEVYGSLDIGKKPGLNLISNFDFEEMTLKEDSIVRKIV